MRSGFLTGVGGVDFGGGSAESLVSLDGLFDGGGHARRLASSSASETSSTSSSIIIRCGCWGAHDDE